MKSHISATVRLTGDRKHCKGGLFVNMFKSRLMSLISRMAVILVFMACFGLLHDYHLKKFEKYIDFYRKLFFWGRHSKHRNA